jgi:hypothetical protein
MQARRWVLGYLAFAVALLSVGFLCRPAHAAGSSVWNAVSVSVGGQGRWLDQGTATPSRDFEAAANGALSLTPHVSVTAGVAYGIDGQYVRGQTDARLTATDANDPNFNVWLGGGWYFSKHESDGLNEPAAKAGLGWRFLRDRPFVLGATAAYGLDTGRRCVTISAVYAFKITKGETL